VITDFNEGMNQSVSKPMGDVMAKGAPALDLRPGPRAATT